MEKEAERKRLEEQAERKRVENEANNKLKKEAHQAIDRWYVFAMHQFLKDNNRAGPAWDQMFLEEVLASAKITTAKPEMEGSKRNIISCLTARISEISPS